VRPGDTIILEKYDRQVTIEGEVRRPGTYQLLEGEGLKELIEQYGDGYTEVADRNRIELTRYVAGKSDSGEKIYITKDEIEKHYQLNNLDRIIIKNITDLKPVLFIEGAIKNENNATTALEGTNKATIQFETGMNYATLVRNVRGLFSYVSDTENSYIIRNGKKIPMNLNPMLFDASYKSEFFIEPYDSLIIPFKQFFITVSGAVRNPGRYPYIPDRDWQYYIALAGGFDEQKNSGEEITIYDINGRKLKKTDGLSPECKIVAHSNSFLYYYNQYSPVVMTTLSLITTLLSIYAITSR
jgi:protein involved in polysaccharide export with SLBB domain